MRSPKSIKTSACIEMLFAAEPLERRFDLVKEYGFCAAEFWKWSNKDIDLVERKLKEHALSLSIMNIDSADERLSYDLSRGILNAGRGEDLVRALHESAPVYRRLNAKALIVLIGERIEGMEEARQLENTYNALLAGAKAAEELGVALIVEPLNHFDRVNYFMPWAKPVLELVKQVNSPCVKMLYDIYHQHRMGDFSMEDVRENIDRIGHFHVADCPGRHEPGTGEVDYISILREISGLDYDGYVGLEYRPLKPEGETFGFLEEVGV